MKTSILVKFYGLGVLHKTIRLPPQREIELTFFQ